MDCDDRMRWNWTHLLALGLWTPVGAALLAHGAPATATAVWLGLCLLGFGLAERRWPYRRDWQPSTRAMSMDAALLLAAAVVDGMLKHGGLWLAQVLASLGHSPGWAASWPLGLAVPAAVLAGELGPYALHRWAHRNAWGWRWHRLHHAPTQVNTSNSVRVHPLNLAWNVASRGLPWWALGFSAEALAWATMFMLLQGVAVHANVAGRIGPLAWLIGSAEAHRLHHSTQPDEALNYGTSVPLWDQLLGTWRAPTTAGPQEVGLHR
ncbi:sterol desaturase family protein [Ideonella paludis]|uniref:Sterol desaturase family protein n=1 Tax=Ideonella paludis TaxID=1233411 RepID=A0ABS5DS06_9BURK|nr:sterol desaturase family protein [Ideonella paludis]MBQ0933902.1 sterol desaturase family protein [Ideonella paludis]